MYVLRSSISSPPCAVHCGNQSFTMVSKILISASNLIAYKVHVHHKTDCIYCIKPDFCTYTLHIFVANLFSKKQQMDCSVCIDPSQHYQVDFYLSMTLAV